MMRMSIVSIVIFTLFSCTCIRSGQTARILAVEIYAYKSHWNFMSGVLRALTDNGHNVTVFTPFLDGNRENYTEIDMSSEFPKQVDRTIKHMRKICSDQFTPISYMMKLGRQECEQIHKNDRLNDLLANQLQTDFDAIIIQPALVSGCLSYLGANSNLPIIYARPIPINTYTERIDYGDINNPATVSTLLLHSAVPRTFVHRLTNTLVWLYTSIVVRLQEYLLELFDSKTNHVVKTSNPPSLVFMNTHFISDAPRPTPSNIVHVGGIHLKPPKKIPQVTKLTDIIY